MIGPALVALLLSNTTIATLVTAARITPARFEQGAALPCLFYSTDNIRPLNCRAGRGIYTGTLEISILAKSYADVTALIWAIRQTLDGKTTTSAAISLTLEPGTERPDESLSDNSAYYKQLDFPVYVTPL